MKKDDTEKDSESVISEVSQPIITPEPEPETPSYQSPQPETPAEPMPKYNPEKEEELYEEMEEESEDSLMV